jgi:hypothetical protein
VYRRNDLTQRGERPACNLHIALRPRVVIVIA